MPHDTAPRSLTSLRPGEPAEIRSILFDSVRDHCATAGVREGSRVVSLGARGSDLALETHGGRVVVLNGILARFVMVGDGPAPAI